MASHTHKVEEIRPDPKGHTATQTPAERVIESFRRGRKSSAVPAGGREAAGMSFDEIEALDPDLLK